MLESKMIILFTPANNGPHFFQQRSALYGYFLLCMLCTCTFVTADHTFWDWFAFHG